MTTSCWARPANGEDGKVVAQVAADDDAAVAAAARPDEGRTPCPAGLEDEW